MRKLLVFVFLAIIVSCELAHEDNSMAEIISKKKLLKLVNDLRKEGCDCGSTYMPPATKLEWDYQLERAALAHSIDMNVQNYFSHTSLDGTSSS